MFKFENLEIWKKAIDLVVKIDEVVKQFPKEEIYVLTSQIKRAGDSISLNIAEGSQGQTNPEFSRFLSYAMRSCIEVLGCIYIAKARKIIREEDFKSIYDDCETLVKMIQSLRNKISK
ncbi:MAG: four helix bundle protein [Bacteroidota bacterium]